MRIILSFTYLSALATFLVIIISFLIKQVMEIIKEEFIMNDIRAKIQQNLDTYEERYIIGSLCINKKMYEQAIEQLEISLLKSQEIAEDLKAYLYNSLGFAYFKLQNYNRAISYYQKALNIKPNYVIALSNLAYLYEKVGVLSKALDTYKLILTFNFYHLLANKKINTLSPRVK